MPFNSAYELLNLLNFSLWFSLFKKCSSKCITLLLMFWCFLFYIGQFIPSGIYFNIKYRKEIGDDVFFSKSLANFPDAIYQFTRWLMCFPCIYKFHIYIHIYNHTHSSIYFINTRFCLSLHRIQLRRVLFFFVLLNTSASVSNITLFIDFSFILFFNIWFSLVCLPFINFFINLSYLFLAVLGLCCCTWAFSSCS